MTIITAHDYTTEINDIASNLVESVFNEYDEVTTKDEALELINDSLLHETIDGHQWVIYTAYHLPIVEHSNNDEYMVDNFGAEALEESLKQGGLSGLHQAIAFWALHADVSERIEDALDTYCEENSID
jgi:hypothetical protein